MAKDAVDDVSTEHMSTEQLGTPAMTRRKAFA
jgi:hypothetical protein